MKMMEIIIFSILVAICFGGIIVFTLWAENLNERVQACILFLGAMVMSILFGMCIAEFEFSRKTQPQVHNPTGSVQLSGDEDKV